MTKSTYFQASNKLHNILKNLKNLTKNHQISKSSHFDWDLTCDMISIASYKDSGETKVYWSVGDYCTSVGPLSAHYYNLESDRAIFAAINLETGSVKSLDVQAVRRIISNPGNTAMHGGHKAVRRYIAKHGDPGLEKGRPRVDLLSESRCGREYMRYNSLSLVIEHYNSVSVPKGRLTVVQAGHSEAMDHAGLTGKFVLVIRHGQQSVTIFSPDSDWTNDKFGVCLERGNDYYADFEVGIREERCNIDRNKFLFNLNKGRLGKIQTMAELLSPAIFEE